MPGNQKKPLLTSARSPWVCLYMAMEAEIDHPIHLPCHIKYKTTYARRISHSISIASPINPSSSMSSLRSKLVVVVLVMAVAAAGSLSLVSAEERPALLRGMAPSTPNSVGGVELPWRHRGEKILAWRWRRNPPSGPSSRGHAVVTVSPDKEEKKQGTAESIDPSVP